MKQPLYSDNTHALDQSWQLKYILIYSTLLSISLTYYKWDLPFLSLLFTVLSFYLFCLFIGLVFSALNRVSNYKSFESKKSIYIQHIHSVEGALCIQLLDKSELRLNYTDLSKIDTWKSGEYVLEDSRSGRRYIFTKFIKNANGKDIFENEDGDIIVVFDFLTALLNEKLSRKNSDT